MPANNKLDLIQGLKG